MIILSGSIGDGREFAGVGFIVAPWLRRSVVGFKQVDARIATIKLRVRGGRLAIVNGYAPHNGQPHDVRQQFYSHLSEVYSSTGCHGMKMIIGDHLLIAMKDLLEILGELGKAAM